MITRDNPYFPQVSLLVGVLPFVALEQCFALKGGTAINLFVRDMPRLSVDIDLAFNRYVGSALFRQPHFTQALPPLEKGD